MIVEMASAVIQALVEVAVTPAWERARDRVARFIAARRDVPLEDVTRQLEDVKEESSQPGRRTVVAEACMDDLIISANSDPAALAELKVILEDLRRAHSEVGYARTVSQYGVGRRHQANVNGSGNTINFSG